MKLPHYKELDGIRAIAALMVMFFHFLDPIVTDSKLPYLGWAGVSLFFVMSGFLITRILINTKASKSYFKVFYIRRALRIFPLYYFFLLVYYFLLPIVQNTPLIPIHQQIWYWIYLQNFAITFNWNVVGPLHFWSLGVEEHFYLFWPLLIYFLTKPQIKFAIFLLIGIAFLIRMLLLQSNLDVYYFTYSRMDELCLGSLLAIFEIEGKIKPRHKKFFLMMFSLVIITTITLGVFTSGLRLTAIHAIKFNLVSLTCFCLIGFILASKENYWLKKVLSQKPFSFTAKISYGLYVYHSLCYLLIDSYLNLNSILLSFLLKFGLSFLVSILSYEFIESRFLFLKSMFQYNRVPQKNMTGAPTIQEDNSFSIKQ